MGESFNGGHMTKAEKPSGIVNIRGRDYETVAYRVQKFRDAHPDWTLVTEVLTRDPDCVVIVATVSDELGRVRANGHAEEYRKTSQINRTSALENCETSAIGRALASLGMGGVEFASANEVANAIGQQKQSGIHKPTDGALDGLEEDRQKVVLDYAAEIAALLTSNEDEAAYAMCEKLTDADEKVAMWSHLDSRQRARIKKQSELSKRIEYGTQA